MDELIEEVKSTIALCPSSRPLSAFKLEQIMQTLLEKIVNNLPFYKALLVDENKIYGFQSKMEDIIKSTVNEGLNNTPLDISKELLLQYIASAFMGIVIWWVKNEQSFTPAEIASQFGKILTQGHFKAAGIALGNGSVRPGLAID